MPALIPSSASLPFIDSSDKDINETLAPEVNNTSIDFEKLRNGDKTDHTAFADIDPNHNFLSTTILKNYIYFTEVQFNILPYTINQFSIFKWNIRSSRSNFDSVRHYTDEFKHKFLVYALTET